MKTHITKKFLILSFVLLLIPSMILADEFHDWMKEEMGEFKKYQDERDKDFSEMLNKDWRAFQMSFALKRDAKPKPVIIPTAPKPKISSVPDTKPKIVVKTKKLPPPPSPPITKKIKKRQHKGTPLTVEFYGVTIALKYDPHLVTRLGSTINKTSISDFWKVLSTSDYKPLMAQLLVYRKAMKLNDWAYAELVNSVGEAIYSRRSNEAKIFDWFMLSKAGYSARIGFNDRSIYLMLPAKSKMYGVSFFTYDGRRYYVVSFSGRAEKVKTLYSYEGNYARATALIDLSITQLPQFQSSIQQKEMRFRFEKKSYQLSVRYDRNLVDFFDHYPITELNVYFASALSQELRYTLLSELKPMVEGKSEEVAVNLLLRFVQTAFEYKTDGDQFGREKYFFPEELFLYPFSDCEDRSILFAYLVRNLLGLEVVGIDYPGHVATAVQFRGNVKGSAITYRNKRYVISDPTYINANTGMVMPRYKNTKAKVIPIAKF